MDNIRHTIKKEDIDTIINEIMTKLYLKFDYHGYHSVISTHEALGRVTEEYNELIKAVRKNDIDNFNEELEDIIIECLWSRISKIKI